MNRRAAGLALGIVLAAQALVVATTAARDPHIDEVEYLHAGWLMANGERLYETFFEHHSPLLFAPLAALAPQGERVDAQPYAMRARLLFGFAGLVAMGAFAAVLWRADPWAAVIGVSALFASGPLWLRVIADVRAEPVALALFWMGVACCGGQAIVPVRDGRDRLSSTIIGVGIGLLVMAGLWTPKWPLTSAFIAVLALVRSTRRLQTVAVALVVATCGLLAIRALTTFQNWLFFGFTVNAPLVLGRAQRPRELLRSNEPFLHAPELFLPVVMVVVAVIVLVLRRDRIAALFVAFFAVAAIELRLVLPYPYLWTHYFAMWSFAGAALLALVPRSLERIRGAKPAAVAVALLVLWANAIALWGVGRSGEGIHWASQRTLAASMRPGETVWIASERHPITVRDAHYYWFAAPEIAGALASLDSPLLPRGDDLPRCGAERMRFISRNLAGDCPNLKRTGVPDILEVGR